MPKTVYTYALRLTGTDKQRLPMDRCAEYLKHFAELLGGESSVHFDGIGKGSALLRAQVDPDHRFEAYRRILQAGQIEGSEPYRAREAINDALARDGFGAELRDAADQVLLRFTPTIPEPHAEAEVYDNASLDGVVVGLLGADDTAHVRLRDATGHLFTVVVRDLGMARELATRWRDRPVRIHVRGKWRRRPEDGVWVQASAGSLTADGFEDLDDTAAADVFRELREIPGVEWGTMDAPLDFWRQLRG